MFQRLEKIRFKYASSASRRRYNHIRLFFQRRFNFGFLSARFSHRYKRDIFAPVVMTRGTLTAVYFQIAWKICRVIRLTMVSVRARKYFHDYTDVCMTYNRMYMLRDKCHKLGRLIAYVKKETKS